MPELIPGEEYVCKVCAHYRPGSLFCTKRRLQQKMFCREFNSYKIKVYVRRWDPSKKKVKEVYVFSRCLTYRETLKLATLLQPKNAKPKSKAKAPTASVGVPTTADNFTGKDTMVSKPKMLEVLQ
jgi:hypothetical protein